MPVAPLRKHPRLSPVATLLHGLPKGPPKARKGGRGISDLAERADMASRSICLTLPSIPETQRKFERDFWKQLEEAQPRILAAILDATSCALRRHT
ncbi:hypothetical protein [Parasedimentitalea psychrophila]|uniref:Uncharacterized protein n=1 Tax=Parasedimentitalea psychrophila TaxID=2997337 RepID=A0A9Y2L3B2_9RHOB|nr:hypothetical protein [Parasedimentitalea psychrophila]WIY27353.1 hypothetical protein QPJ95_10805 [Parasedimentitalea psychrophila]